MSLRKIAVLLAAGGITVGLIGGGVGAQFTDQVTANQNISVGSFKCIITDGGGGTVAADQKSVAFTSTILSSAPDTAPVHFTVENAGTINALLTVTASPALSAPFSYLPLAPAPLTFVAAGASQLVSGGVQWTELTNANLNTSANLTYTVACVDHS